MPRKWIPLSFLPNAAVLLSSLLPIAAGVLVSCRCSCYLSKTKTTWLFNNSFSFQEYSV